MEIRYVEEEDFEGIYTMSESCGVEAGMKQIEPSQIASLLIRSLDKELGAYVAVEDDKIVGAVVFSPASDNFSAETDIVVIHICVDRNYRDSGVFEKLLNNIKDNYKGCSVAISLPRMVKHKLLQPTGYIYEVK